MFGGLPIGDKLYIGEGGGSWHSLLPFYRKKRSDADRCIRGRKGDGVRGVICSGTAYTQFEPERGKIGRKRNQGEGRKTKKKRLNRR